MLCSSTDNENLYFYCADISSVFLEQLRRPDAPPPGPTSMSIRVMLISLKPYKSLRDRLLFILYPGLWLTPPATPPHQGVPMQHKGVVDAEELSRDDGAPVQHKEMVDAEEPSKDDGVPVQHQEVVDAEEPSKDDDVPVQHQGVVDVEEPSRDDGVPVQHKGVVDSEELSKTMKRGERTPPATHNKKLRPTRKNDEETNAL